MHTVFAKGIVVSGLAFALGACQSQAKAVGLTAEGGDAGQYYSARRADCAAGGSSVDLTPQDVTRPQNLSTQGMTRVTKTDVIIWNSRGVRDDVIIDRISHCDCVAPLTAVDENELRDARVSEDVIRAMKDASSRE